MPKTPGFVTTLKTISPNKKVFCPIPLFIITILILIPTLIFGTLQYPFFQEQLQRLNNILLIRSITHVSPNLTVQQEILSLRGNPLTIRAIAEKPVTGQAAFIHIASSGGWQTFPAESQGNVITYRLASLYQKSDFYFSTGKGLSNRGTMIPLDPPAIADGTVAITPAGLYRETERNTPASSLFIAGRQCC